MANDKPTRLGRGLDALLSRPTPRSSQTVPAETKSERSLDTPPPFMPQASAEVRTNTVDVPEKTPAAASGTLPNNGQNSTAEAPPTRHQLQNLSIAQIAPNPFQPRKEFRPEDLAELESSLRQSGLLQPITVRPAPRHAGQFELIAGERRLRAATRLGWTEIPALVRPTDDRTMLTLAMVENLQRADLDPVEEADGYQRLVAEFELTQQEVADVVGKDRSTIANALRLLALPASVKRMLQERQLTVGHARALLPLANERAMAELSREIVLNALSVRDVENRVRGTRPTPATTGRKSNPNKTFARDATRARESTAEARRVEELLRKKMQTTVSLHLTGKEQGEVRIAFYSNDDLERLLGLLGVNVDT